MRSIPRHVGGTASRGIVRATLAALVGLAAVSPSATGRAAAPDPLGRPGLPQGQGLTVYESNATFAETVARARPAIEARDLILMDLVDHAAAASRVGATLAPNTVILFGHPAVGSQLMTCEPRVGIDLPQKLLIWEADGLVRVAHNSVAHLVARHGLAGCEALLARVAETLTAIATEVATGTRGGEPGRGPDSPV